MAARFSELAGLISLGFLFGCGSDGFSTTQSAQILCDPQDEVVFARVRTGQSDVKSLEIRQGGSADLKVKEIYIESSYDAATNKDACSKPQQGLSSGDTLSRPCTFVIEDHPALQHTLSTDEFMQVSLRYQPQSASDKESDNLIIVSNSLDEPSKVVRLKVRAAAATLGTNTSTLAFERLEPGKSATQMLLVKNLGSSPLTVTALETKYKTPTDAGEPFAIEFDHPLPWTIKENESEVVTVRYTPTDETADVMELSFTSNDTSVSRYAVTVTSGPVYSLLAANNPVVFGEVTGTQSRTQVLTIKNPGDMPLSVLSMKFEDGSSFSLGTQQTSFQLNPLSTRDFTIVHTAGGATTDVLRIESDADNATVLNAQNPERSVTEIHLVETAAESPVILNPSPYVLAFTNESSLKLTISNPTASAISLDSMELVTDSDGIFLLSDVPASIEAGASAEVAVSLNRAAGDQNAYFGRVEIKAGDFQTFVPVSAIP